MAYNRRQAGLMGFTKLGLFQLASMLPGSMGDRGAQKMMAIVWRNYFDLPAAAPPPDPTWLAGVKRRPVWETRKAARAADAAGLNQIQLPLDTRVLILFGERDIYGPTTVRLFERYPQAGRARIVRPPPLAAKPDRLQAGTIRLLSAGPGMSGRPDTNSNDFSRFLCRQRLKSLLRV